LEKITLDSLPYIEPLSIELRAHAERLVLEEINNKKIDLQQENDHLKHLPMPKCSIIDSNEFEQEIEKIQMRIRNNNEKINNNNENENENEENNQEYSILDEERYKILGPKKDQIHALPIWNRSIENVQAQLEHNKNCNINLEIFKKYGSLKWKNYTQELKNINDYYNKILQKKEKEIEELNRIRKQKQTEIGPQLRQLETEWWTMVRKNNEIELQCELLKRNIQKLHAPKAFR